MKHLLSLPYKQTREKSGGNNSHTKQAWERRSTAKSLMKVMLMNTGNARLYAHKNIKLENRFG